MFLGVKYNLWNLAIFDRGTIIVSCSVRELESHPAGATTCTVDTTLTQSFRTVVGVESLEINVKSKIQCKQG